MSTETARLSGQETLNSGAGYNHIAPWEDITRSLVEGTPLRALCGASFVVEAQGGGEVSSSRLEDCPSCDNLFGMLTGRSYRG